jgi:hypothetical protein
MMTVKTYNVFDTIRVRPPFLRRMKGKTMSKFTNLFVNVLGWVGVLSHVFVFAAGNNLTPRTGNMFELFGSVCFGIGVLTYIALSKTEADFARERENLYRDWDNCYRYIDDGLREVRDEMKELNRVTHCCDVKNSRK